MEVNTIVELVALATTENARKLQATQVLDQIRASPDRWSIGLRLFLEAPNEMTRFFGLSLVRDWMQCQLQSSCSSTDFASQREQIRRTMMSWLAQLLQDMSNNPNSAAPFYLISNAISVLTLSVKFDFPVYWPNAFAELLQLGYAHGVPGIDLVVKVLKELEVEVVMFSETRSKTEIALNTAVKDAMRESPVMEDIVIFLCNSAQHALASQRTDLCASCLHSLAELVAWINVVLVLERALPTVRQLWQCPHAAVRAACLGCYYELVKKGMDPVAKVRLLQSIGLVQELAQEPRLQSLLQNTSVARPGRQGLSEDEEREVWQAGALADMIALELLGCWSKYEDLVCGGKASRGGGASPASAMSNSGDPTELPHAVPVVVGFLQQLLPFLLQMFGHKILKVSCTALPSCTRLVTILRSQQTRAAQLQSQEPGMQFRAEEYVYPLLSAVYSKSQYPAGFDFEAALEDELDEETEAKSEVRKLFVNCCRVRPDRCLELLVAVMSSQPLPLSQAPFPALEAALRLVYAFSECGQNSQSKLLSEGAFPELIRALHQSDVAQHAHPQVVLVYFEITHRYIRYLDRAAIVRLFAALLGQHGVLSENAFLRGRAAYFLLKVAETQEARNASVVDAVFPTLTAILTETASVELRTGFGKRATVSEQSELYLCETAALLSSSHGTSSGEAAQGSELLRGIIDVELGQMHHALCLLAEQPQLVEAISATLTKRVAALAGLTKGFTNKGHPSAVPVFEHATSAVVAVAQRLAFHRPLRAKILIYLHRMVACIGPRVRPYAESILPVLLAQADATDADDVVQVLNQLMVEYTVDCLPMVQELLGVVVDKYTLLSAALESSSTPIVPADVATEAEGGAMQAPHLHTERLNLHRQFLLFIQHVATCGCSAALYSTAHLPRLEGILFSVVLPALDGGAVSSDPSRDQSSTALKVNPNHIGNSDTQDSVPVRKGALVILNGLTTAWLLPPAPGSAEAASPPPPAEVASALRSYLLEHALPRALFSVSGWCYQYKDGGSARSQLNVRDAAAQSVLVELAVLLRSAHSLLSLDPVTHSPSDASHSAAYFQKVLTSLGWPSHCTQPFLELLTAATPLGTYKEAFKKLVRASSELF